jgi:hypothetical protein
VVATVPSTSPADAPRLALPAALSRRLEALFLEVPPERAQLVRVKQLGDAHAAIRHEVDGVAFAYLYFGANFAKTYLAADLARRGHAINLLDLGAGSGASICGLAQRCHDDGIRIAELAIVDRCEPQLALFRRVALPWLRELYPDLRIVTAGADAVDWLSADRTHWDVISASYLFCELTPAQRPALEALLARRSREGTRSLVVDSLGRETVSLDPASGRWRPLGLGSFRIALPFVETIRLSEPPRYSLEELTRPASA